MRLNDNIRRLRREVQLTQDALGALLGVSGQAVSKWEQGATSPDISLLPALAECFHVPIDALFQDVPGLTHYGYGSRRGELHARYMSEGGTEEDFRRAAEAYSEVLLNGEPTVDDRIAYAELYSRRAGNDFRIAVRTFRNVIHDETAPRTPEWMRAHQELTNLLCYFGRTDEAVAEMRAWAQREPGCTWAHISYGYALEKAGDAENALNEVELALSIDENDANAQQTAGDLLAQLERYEEAFPHWENAFRLMPSSISCLFSMAAAYEKMGSTEKAIRQYEEILVWLEQHGFDMKLEGLVPNRRIQALREGN